MKLLLVVLLFIILPVSAWAQNIVLDSDNDGLTDWQEEYQFYTDKNNPDTDGDGFSDAVELNYHYSPHQFDLRLSNADQDNDGLSDWLEWQFNTNWLVSDTDGDGFSDFVEVSHGFDPLNPKPEKLPQKIVIDTDKQTVSAYLNDVQLTAFSASTGKPGYDTPKGIYKVENKSSRAWSNTYGLWMPYWMGFIGAKYGIHELPEWPNGYKEGQDHLGTPVSHGCVRLGVGAAEWLYNWAEIGTEVDVL